MLVDILECRIGLVSDLVTEAEKIIMKLFFLWCYDIYYFFEYLMIQSV